MQSESLPLTKAQQQSLQQQIISDKTPCSIVRDFNDLLEFIGMEGIETPGKYGLIPMAKLAEINVRLTHSIQLSSKRPIQKTYPHINGLYLLLRSTEIGHIRKVGKKSFLSVHQDALQSWKRLNPTEQYCDYSHH